MRSVWLMGGPGPYREAMTARLESLGVAVAQHEPLSADRSSTVAIAYCTDGAAWQRLESLEGYLGRTAVIDSLDLALYVRALQAGLGVVHADNASQTIVDVATASGRHETLLPAEVARQISHGVASQVPAERPDLTPLEMDLLRSIAKGETLASIGERYFYSERTLRRRLQSVYLKLAVRDRVGAVRAADRLGLLSPS